MKIVVTGANGFLGSAVTRRLADEGHEVFALVRKSSDLTELDGVKCQLIFGDVTDRKSLNAAFAGMDSVFHLAGLIAYKKSERAKMDLINVEGTRNVVDACIDSHIRRLLYLSSVVAVGAGLTSEQVLNENSPYNIHELDLGYFETKHEAEHIVMQAVREKRLDAVAVNPSTIYGAADAKKGSRKTQVKVAQGKFPFFTNGGVSVVALEDVLDGVLAAWEKGRSGERYILSGDNITIEELFKMIATEAGVEPPKYRIPNFALHAMGIIGDALSAFGKESSLSRENAHTATMYHWFDCSKAKAELGFKPRPAKFAIANSVRWMKENGIIS